MLNPEPAVDTVLIMREENKAVQCVQVHPLGGRNVLFAAVSCQSDWDSVQKRNVFRNQKLWRVAADRRKKTKTNESGRFPEDERAPGQVNGRRVAGSGCYLCRRAAGAEHGVEMFDEDLGEDVDGGQSGQRDRTLARPNQVHPEHTGQIRRTHLVHDALLRHLTMINNSD